MKMNLVMSVSAICSLCFSTAIVADPIIDTSHADNELEFPGGNKGHFVLSTNIIEFGAGTFTRTSDPASETNTSDLYAFKGNPWDFNLSINIGVGYYVSNKTCFGLNFNNYFQSIPPWNFPYYIFPLGPYGQFSAIVPSSIYARYSVYTSQSGKCNIMAEANAGGSYAKSNCSFRGQTDPVKEMGTIASLNSVFSVNTSQHFSLQLKAGIMYNYQQYNIYNFDATKLPIGEVPPPWQTVFTAVSFAGSFSLQYKL
jgi:hypothetical protein